MATKIHRRTAAQMVLRFDITEMDSANFIAEHFRSNGYKTRKVYRGPRRLRGGRASVGHKFSFTYKADATAFDLYIRG